MSFCVIISAIFIQSCAAQIFGGSVNGRAVINNPGIGTLGLTSVPSLAYGPSSFYNAPMPYEGLTNGLTLATLAAAPRGGMSVSSVTPIAPNGIRVQAENILIEGPVAVNGKVPFLGTVNFDGSLPSGGVGNVMYGCGNGNIGILKENHAIMSQGPSYNSLGPYINGNFISPGRCGCGALL